MISKNRIKYLTSLKQKKFRSKYNQFLVEGDKIVKELLSQKEYPVLQIIATDDWIQENPSFTDELQNLEVAGSDEMGRISSFVSSPEVIALVPTKTAAVKDLSKGRYIYLDRIQDPGNFGTIWRTADWFGIDGLICSPGTVDPYNPKVIQSSMGAFLRVNIHPEVELTSEALEPINTFAADMSGLPIAEVDWPADFVICVGNESAGLSADISEITRIQKITIPAGERGGAESLNVAMATGIILYEAMK